MIPRIPPDIVPPPKLQGLKLKRDYSVQTLVVDESRR